MWWPARITLQSFMVGTRRSSRSQAASGPPQVQTPRKKTKAKPIRSLRSPDIEPAAAASKGEDSSLSSSSSKRPGLDPFIQKALAELLEGPGGGINKYKKNGEQTLAKLLEEDTEHLVREVTLFVVRSLGTLLGGPKIHLCTKRRY